MEEQKLEYNRSTAFLSSLCSSFIGNALFSSGWLKNLAYKIHTEIHYI